MGEPSWREAMANKLAGAHLSSRTETADAILHHARRIKRAMHKDKRRDIVISSRIRSYVLESRIYERTC